MKFDHLNPVLGAPARVAILATLSDGRDWLFADLRDETGLADGNLHVQTGKLRDAGYVDIAKVNAGGRRVTRFRLTEKGREALAAFANQLVRALKRAEQDAAESSAPSPVRKNDGSRVW